MSPPPNSVTPVSLPARLRARLSRALVPPTIVLLYHRVLPAIERDTNRLVTRTDNFAAHLAWLSEHCRPLTTGEFLDNLDRPGRTGVSLDGKPRVLITFDDGYADNVHHALPILVEHGLHAVVFATSSLVGTHEPFWWDALDQIIFDAATTGPWTLPDGTTLHLQGDRMADYQAIRDCLKPLPADVRRNTLQNLARQAGVPPRTTDDSRPMSWDELRGWLAAGMAVGGHTRTHAQLSALSDEQVRDEIRWGKQELESGLRAAVETFAYPYGSAADFDERAEQAVASVGFRSAFANYPGNARWARSLYALPRYLVRDWTADELAGRLEEWTRP